MTLLDPFHPNAPPPPPQSTAALRHAKPGGRMWIVPNNAGHAGRG